jgi:O-acetyl-ADP-ribose deacetylase (regulator of RNase III)
MISYIKGDATCPQASGPKVIAHICNDVGGWGKGFVLAISKRWVQPEVAYRKWYNNRKINSFGLGNTDFILVNKDLWVANMVAQHGLGTHNGQPPIRYDSLEKCLESVATFSKDNKASVHMPRIGCGLAGGRWDKIEPVILKCLEGVLVFVYDL